MWRDASPILVGFVKSDKPSSNQINTTSRRLLERVNRKPFVNRSLWHKRIRCLRPDFHYYNFSLPLTPWEIQEYEIVLNNCFVTLESSKICSEFLFLLFREWLDLFVEVRKIFGRLKIYRIGNSVERLNEINNAWWNE